VDAAQPSASEQVCERPLQLLPALAQQPLSPLALPVPAALREAVERVRKLYDRLGAAADGGLGEVVRAVREGTAAAVRAGRSLAAAGRAAERGERSLADVNRAARRASDTLGRVLRDARCDLVLMVTVMRQRGPHDRDHGPSR